MKKEQHHFSSELYFDFCGFSKTLPFHAVGPAGFWCKNSKDLASNLLNLDILILLL
ncbi:hypothetical protein MHI17_28265 [Bacillus sp. FSL L8-0098]|uniref:hypothetical protein n=1 Tax=Bacillus sp. FSL L8-0098 TaxID=2921513 RepID=UPI0030FB3F19